MELKNLKYEVEGKVGILTVNRPKVLNALNAETVREIIDTVSRLKEEGDISVLVVTGEGEKAFVAGADINEFVGQGVKEGFEFSRSFQEMTSSLEKMGIPTIAMVNGLALGGGCEIALACSIRVLSEQGHEMQ